MRYAIAVLAVFVTLVAYALYPMFLFPDLSFQLYYKSQIFKLSVRFADIVKFRQELYKVRNTTMESPNLYKTTLHIHYNTSSELYLPERDNEKSESNYLLRIYQPKQFKTGGYPVMMYMHGGGWVLNHIDVYDQFCRKMSERGFIVVSVGYRKAPEHVFPACLNDVLNAMSWIGKNLRDEKYNANLNQFTISGDSGGGHLAVHAVVRSILLDQEVSKREQLPRVHYQALLYPAVHYYMSNRTRFESYKTFGDYGYILDGPVLEKFWRYLVGSNTSDEELSTNPFLSVLSAYDPRLESSKVLYSKLPSGFVITAEYDILRDEGAEYARIINEAANGTAIVKHMLTPKAVHGFAQFPTDEMASNFAAIIKSFFSTTETTQGTIQN